jgi:acetyl-CoA carboxylase carboxyl transferase subunit beta
LPDRRKNAPLVRSSQEASEDDGLWSKCPECSLVVYRKDLLANASVCSNCGHHHRIDSATRIALIADPGSFEPLDRQLSPADPLGFKDRRGYADRIRDTQQSTGLQDAVSTGICRIEGLPWPWGRWISASWVARWARWWAKNSPA